VGQVPDLPSLIELEQSRHVSPVVYPALFLIALIAKTQFKADTNLQQVAVQVTDKLGRPVHGFSGRRLPVFGGDFGPQCAREIGGGAIIESVRDILGDLRRGESRERPHCPRCAGVRRVFARCVNWGCEVAYRSMRGGGDGGRGAYIEVVQ
jgi:hypothetical protein